MPKVYNSMCVFSLLHSVFLDMIVYVKRRVCG